MKEREKKGKREGEREKMLDTKKSCNSLHARKFFFSLATKYFPSQGLGDIKKSGREIFSGRSVRSFFLPHFESLNGMDEKSACVCIHTQKMGGREKKKTFFTVVSTEKKGNSSSPVCTRYHESSSISSPETSLGIDIG